MRRAADMVVENENICKFQVAYCRAKSDNSQVCNIWREPVVVQPIKISDLSVSTRDPQLLNRGAITWSGVIGHVGGGGGACSSTETRTVRGTERDVIRLRMRDRKHTVLSPNNELLQRLQ